MRRLAQVAEDRVVEQACEAGLAFDEVYLRPSLPRAADEVVHLHCLPPARPVDQARWQVAR